MAYELANGEVGYTEIEGTDGAVDETGASLPSPKLMVIVPNRGRRLPMGLETKGLVAAGSTGDASSDPQVPFRMERFIVPSDIAAFFRISELSIGADNMLASPSTSLPARGFDEEATQVLMGLDTNDPGTTIDIKVINITLVPYQFTSLALGVAVVR